MGDFGFNVLTFNNIFSGFFPVAVDFLRRIPVLGTLLSLPGIRGVSVFCTVLFSES